MLTESNSVTSGLFCAFKEDYNIYKKFMEKICINIDTPCCLW